MALTFKQIDAVLARITYKPGWTWRAVNGRGVVTIEIQACLLDVRNHAVEFRLRHHVHIVKSNLTLMGSSNVVEILFGAIRELELHELDEWFRVDRLPLRKPHVQLPLDRLRRARDAASQA